MFQRRQKRFGRNRSHDRRHQLRGGADGQLRTRSHSFSNGHTRNKFRPALSAEKLLEKYKNLAKEALSFGDKTLHENFLQHVDHFTRVVDDKNRNQNQNRTQFSNKITVVDKNLTESENINQDKKIEEKKEQDPSS